MEKYNDIIDNLGQIKEPTRIRNEPWEYEILVNNIMV